MEFAIVAIFVFGAWVLFTLFGGFLESKLKGSFDVFAMGYSAGLAIISLSLVVFVISAVAFGYFTWSFLRRNSK